MSGRIAIVGPESTGKSTLAADLAAALGTRWVPEYARAYLDRLRRPYDAADVVRIGRGQLALEEALAPRTQRPLVCDTNLLVVRIWMEHAYGAADGWVAAACARRHYDLWLLTDVDLPWSPDPQREHPHLRGYFFDWYHREVAARGDPWCVVRGNRPGRLARALAAVEALDDGQR